MSSYFIQRGACFNVKMEANKITIFRVVLWGHLPYKRNQHIIKDLGLFHRHRPASVLSTKEGISCYLVFEDNLSSLRHHHLTWQLGQNNRMLSRFRMSATGLCGMKRGL